MAVRIPFSVLLAALLLILSGCGPKAPTEPAKADFSFLLPPGASFEDVTDTTASIVMDGRTVGGITLTDIEGKSTEKLKDDVLFRYIDSCAPAPLIGEWISMYFEEDGHSMIRVDLKVTDPDTGTVANYTHTLFMKEEGVYDLWLDDALVSDDMRALFSDIVIASRE